MAEAVSRDHQFEQSLNALLFCNQPALVIFDPIGP